MKKFNSKVSNKNGYRGKNFFPLSISIMILIIVTLFTFTGCKLSFNANNNDNNGCKDGNHIFDNIIIENVIPEEKTENYCKFTIKECIKCYEKITLYINHEFGEYKSNNDATCLSDGTKTKECINCNYTTDRIIDENSKKPHEFINYVYNNDATCSVNGTKTAICETNGCNETHTIECENTKLTCSWGEWQTIVEPKFNQQGKAERVCLNNPEHKETKIVDALEHDIITVGYKAPTCKDTGNIAHYKCLDCGKLYSNKDDFTSELTPDQVLLPKTTDHNYTQTVHEATCKDIGYTEHSCTICGDNYVDSQEPPVDCSYTYDVSTYNKYLSTLGFECKWCKQIVYKEITKYDTILANNCNEKSYDLFKCEELNIIDIKIENKEEAFPHLFEGQNINNLLIKIEYKNEYDELFDKGILSWMVSGDNTETERFAVYKCQECGGSFLIVFIFEENNK